MNKVPLMVGGDTDRTNCPTCGMAVRVVRRTYDDRADHYEALIVGEDVAKVLPTQDPDTAAKLRKLRKGKKTVAMVGLAATSCSLAPFDDPDCEIWGLNEAHAFPWMLRWDRWFQIHATESWKRYIAKRDVRGHFDWLKKEYVAEFPRETANKSLRSRLLRKLGERKHTAHQQAQELKPIYMQYWHPQVPGSIGYPLHEVTAECFKNFRRGDEKVKYFTSTIAYMMGIALLENFERIEIYGFELADEIEYVMQKACAEFWIGMALGRGIEVYTPPGNQILHSELYGGDEQGAGW
jgi:hypothetical protein